MPAAADFLAFLREAAAPLFRRRMLVPVLALVALLTFTNIVIARNLPPPDGPLSPPFLAAALVRIGGLVVLAVAITRILAASPRSPWRPDGAFWLALLAIILSFAVTESIEIGVGVRSYPAGLLISSALSALIVAPFSPWLVAIAAEKPLAWSPLPWLRRFGRWLPQLVVWFLLLVTPPAYLHATINTAVVEGRIDRFWLAMLFDGPLSAGIALFGLALNNAAYWRVARS